MLKAKHIFSSTFYINFFNIPFIKILFQLTTKTWKLAKIGKNSLQFTIFKQKHLFSSQQFQMSL